MKKVAQTIKTSMGTEVVVAAEMLTEIWAITPYLEAGTICGEKQHKRRRVLTHLPSGMALGAGAKSNIRKDIITVWNSMSQDLKNRIEIEDVQKAIYNDRELSDELRAAVAPLYQ